MLIDYGYAADGFSRKGVIINNVFPGTLIEGSPLLPVIIKEDTERTSLQ
jgi:hypothetical protein